MPRWIDDLDLTHEEKIFVLQLINQIGPADPSIEEDIRRIQDEAFEDYVLRGEENEIPDPACNKARKRNSR